MHPIIGTSLQDHQETASGISSAERFIKPCEWIYLFRDRREFEKERFAWDLRAKHGFLWQESDGIHDNMKDFDKDLEYIQNNSERYNFATKIGNHGIITDPPAYVKALAEHVSERGGQFLQGTVKDFIISNHRLAGLKLSDDTRIECDECILATGKLF